MKANGDNLTADVFEFDDLKSPIPDNETLNRIAMNRLLLNLRPTAKDTDSNNAAKLVLTYTGALTERIEHTATITNKPIKELSDNELAVIASTGSTRTA